MRVMSVCKATMKSFPTEIVSIVWETLSVQQSTILVVTLVFFVWKFQMFFVLIDVCNGDHSSCMSSTSKVVQITEEQRTPPSTMVFFVENFQFFVL